MPEHVNELWRFLDLEPGVDYLTDRDPSLLTASGVTKIREAERNPPPPAVAAWFRKASAAARAQWDANPSRN